MLFVRPAAWLIIAFLTVALLFIRQRRSVPDSHLFEMLYVFSTLAFLTGLVVVVSMPFFSPNNVPASTAQPTTPAPRINPNTESVATGTVPDAVVPASPPQPHAGMTQPTRDRPSGHVQQTAPQIREPDEHDKRLQQFKSSFNPSIGLVPGKRNIGIFVSTSGPAVDFEPAQGFYSNIRSDKAHFITDILRHDIVSRGYFDEMYAGDHDLVKLAVASSRVDMFILARMKYTFRQSSSVAHDIVCEIALGYKVMGQSGDVSSEDVIRVVHPSYSESAALLGAIKELGQKFAERLF